MGKPYDTTPITPGNPLFDDEPPETSTMLELQPPNAQSVAARNNTDIAYGI